MKLIELVETIRTTNVRISICKGFNYDKDIGIYSKNCATRNEIVETLILENMELYLAAYDVFEIINDNGYLHIRLAESKE